jgi:hypothetical protein
LTLFDQNTKMSHLLDIPQEIQLTILSFLESLDSIVSLSISCKHFNHLINYDERFYKLVLLPKGVPQRKCCNLCTYVGFVLECVCALIIVVRSEILRIIKKWSEMLEPEFMKSFYRRFDFLHKWIYSYLQFAEE